jgi:hypothetical protein
LASNQLPLSTGVRIVQHDKKTLQLTAVRSQTIDNCASLFGWFGSSEGDVIRSNDESHDDGRLHSTRPCIRCSIAIE